MSKRKPVRLCIFCTHMLVSFEDDWSDITPGAGMEVACYEPDDVSWSLRGYNINMDMYRKAILRARGCPHFDIAGGEDGSVARYLRGEEVAL